MQGFPSRQSEYSLRPTMESKRKAIGIDLGTSNSCVAVWQDGQVVIIANDQGNGTTPSMVAFNSSRRLVGEAAKNQIATNPANTVFDVKRLIGMKFKDPCVQNDKGHWPFTVVPGKNDKPMIQFQHRGKTMLLSAEEISAMILEKMKSVAEAFLGYHVKNAVITVPAYFNNSQRKATKSAAKIAGLNVMSIINEPTAAAIAYGFHQGLPSKEKKTILVFDWGGGTLDVSVLTVQRGEIKVKAVGGDTHLGGSDIDNRMLSYCVQQFNKKYRRDLNSSPRALRRLRAECERAKRNLSSAVETVIEIDSLYEGIDFYIKITRAMFEQLNIDLFQKCMKKVWDCMGHAKIGKEKIDDIVLVGGSTRIPEVEKLLKPLLNGKKLCRSINPDEAVAYGAAVQAAILNKEDVKLAVADVTPLSLGIEIDGGLMCVVVPRNTQLPTTFEKHFTTSLDNQLEITFEVYEGEGKMTAYNNFLGKFCLRGISAAQSGLPRVKLVFDVGVDGILKVSAYDEGSRERNGITVAIDTDKLDKEEMARMIGDARKFQRDDEEAAKNALTRSRLESYVNNMKNRLGNAKAARTIDTEAAKTIEQALTSATNWLDDHDYAEVQELEDRLEALKFKCIPLTFERTIY